MGICTSASYLGLLFQDWTMREDRAVLAKDRSPALAQLCLI